MLKLADFGLARSRVSADGREGMYVYVCVWRKGGGKHVYVCMHVCVRIFLLRIEIDVLIILFIRIFSLQGKSILRIML